MTQKLLTRPDTRLLAAAILLAQSALGAPHWISVTSSHFELYTTAREGDAIAAIQTYEQVYYFFSQRAGHPIKLDSRVRVIAFNSEKEFKPYRMNEGNFAFYQPSPVADFIAMQDIQREDLQSAIHEFTHLMIGHDGLQLPVWLQEGMADFYSSLEPYKKDSAMVGRPLPGRASLADQRWMDWNVLFAVDHDSPYYNERNKMSVFYAQSWVLTHMLYLSPEYGPKFHDFALALASGIPTVDAFQKVYRKSVPELDRDVRKYVRSTVRVAVLPVTLPKSDTDPDIEPLDDFHRDLRLAELQAFSPSRSEDGRSRLVALEQAHADVSEIHVALGYVQWQQKNLAPARSEFLLASKTGASNAMMYYHLASLQLQLLDPDDNAIASLEKSLKLDPENTDARLLLGQLYTKNKRYGAAVSTLVVLRHIKPEQAYPLFSTLAFCYVQLNSFHDAEVFAGKATQFAKTDAERSQMESLQNFVQARAAAKQ